MCQKSQNSTAISSTKFCLLKLSQNLSRIRNYNKTIDYFQGDLRPKLSTQQTIVQFRKMVKTPKNTWLQIIQLKHNRCYRKILCHIKLRTPVANEEILPFEMRERGTMPTKKNVFKKFRNIFQIYEFLTPQKLLATTIST